MNKEKVKLKPVTYTFTLTKTYLPTEEFFEDWDTVPNQRSFESEVLNDFYDNVDLSICSHENKGLSKTYGDPVEIEFKFEDFDE